MPAVQKVCRGSSPDRLYNHADCLGSRRLGLPNSYFCDQDCFKRNCELFSSYWLWT